MIIIKMNKSGQTKRTEEMKIPNNQVGKVIGAKGVMIKKIQSESQASCKVTERSGQSYVVFTGFPDQVNRAKDMINKIVYASKTGQISVFLPNESLCKNLEEEVLLVPFGEDIPAMFKEKKCFILSKAKDNAEKDDDDLVKMFKQKLHISSGSEVNFSGEVDRTLKDISVKAKTLDQPINICATFGKFLFFDPPAEKRWALKDLLPAPNFYTKMKNAFSNQFSGNKWIYTQLKDEVKFEDKKERAQLTVWIKSTSDDITHYMLLSGNNGKFTPEYTCLEKQKIIFLNVLNDSSQLDFRVYLRNHPPSNLKASDLMALLKIDSNAHHVDSFSSSFVIEKFRFFETEIYDTTEPNIRLLVHKVWSNDEDLHFEVEVEDKAFKDNFFSKEYSEDELGKRVTSLERFAMKAASKVSLPL
jgi:hypothetical protein